MSRNYFKQIGNPWGEESEHGRRHRCHGEFEHGRDRDFDKWDDDDRCRRYDV